ncbi:MAG: hypothetical protein ACF8R7_17975 [Phycisphaerales bacterium JB039]
MQLDARSLARSPFPIACLLVALLAPGLVGCSSGRSDRAAVDREYAFWPISPAEPRIQFVRSFQSSMDVVPTSDSAFSRLVFGDEAEAAVAIQKPYGIDMNDGRIYVCDIRGQSLTVLDLPEREMRLIGTSGFNRLSNPVDVVVADDGMIYVADTERGGVIVFDQRERFVRAFGHEAFVPIAVAVHGDRLYACSRESQVVEIFDRVSGDHIGSIGSVGDEDGQFRLPLGVDTDRDGNVYVMDMMRARLQKFSPEGEFLAAVGALGDVAGTFARPKQVAVDSEGIIYVVDAAFQNVQMFNADFELLMAFGSAGEFPGAMNLPAGICVAEDPADVKALAGEVHPGFEPKRVVLVTNQFGPAKVSAYVLGQRREGWTVAELSSSAAAVDAGVGPNPETQNLLQIPPDAPDPGEASEDAGGHPPIEPAGPHGGQQ